MKNFSELELVYKPTQEEIDALVLTKYIDAHHALLEVAYTTTINQLMHKVGIKSLRDLYETDIIEISKGMSFGKKLSSILNLQDAIKKELSEKES